MARGAIAKSAVAEKIKEVFGADYVGESGGKHYVVANDGGEKVQIAISLTCPKNPIGEVSTGLVFGDGIDFAAAPVVAPSNAAPAEITQEEKDNIAELMAQLGL
jgi:hypothetical protein